MNESHAVVSDTIFVLMVQCFCQVKGYFQSFLMHCSTFEISLGYIVCPGSCFSNEN